MTKFSKEVETIDQLLAEPWTVDIQVYYLMAYYSGEPQFRAIQYLTLLNPRRGIACRVAVNELFAGTVGIVSKGILGFPDSPRNM